MSLYGMLKFKGKSGFGYNSTAEEVTEGLDLSGKTYLVTGCNSGLGLETCRVLALRGARVIGAARTTEKAENALKSLGDGHVGVACELSEPASVKAAVQSVQATGHALDAIICNAGIMAIPERTVQHGVELQLLTNHIGHFMLVTGLLDQLSATGRVVAVSSALHMQSYKEGVRLDDVAAERGYVPVLSYGQSKLANLLFAKSLAKRLKPGQTANSLHPGVIPTNLGRHFNKVLLSIYNTLGPAIALKTIPQGAATQTYVATHPDAASVSGDYWQDCNPKKPSKHGRDDALAEALWARTEEIVAGF